MKTITINTQNGRLFSIAVEDANYEQMIDFFIDFKKLVYANMLMSEQIELESS
jgi:hypothetical protein